MVAHGHPSAPEGPEAVLRRLARAVEARLPPGARVLGTTLATPGGLAAAVEAAGDRAPLLVYPFFMADGWFVSSELPRRLARCGAGGARVLPPLGLEPGLQWLAVRRAVGAAWRDSAGAAVLLAAHGSPSDPRPARSARAAAATLRATRLFHEVRVGFVDEAPFLADAARGMGPAVCLPWFATRAGHVETDLPEALAAAGFDGPLLPPIGTDPSVPALIAAALGRAAGRDVRRSGGTAAPQSAA